MHSSAALSVLVLLLSLVGCTTETETLESARALMTVLDGDGNGVLSEEEFSTVAHPQEQFEAWDEDGNAQLSAEELEKVLRTATPMVQGHQAGRGSENSPRRRPEPTPPASSQSPSTDQ